MKLQKKCMASLTNTSKSSCLHDSEKKYLLTIKDTVLRNNLTKCEQNARSN